MVVDDSGRVWLASGWKYGSTTLSGMGLCRYDGTSWKVYNDTNSNMPNNAPLCLTLQGNKYLWVGTPDGLVRFDLGNENINVYNSSNTPALKSDFIYSVHFSNGVLWMGTRDGIIKHEGLNVTHYDSSLWGGSKIVYSITTDSNNTVWAGTANGLVKFDQTNWTLYNKQNSNIGSDTIYQVSCDSKNNVWLSTNESEELGTICRFSNGNFYSIWEMCSKNTRHLPIKQLRAFAIGTNDEIYFPGQIYTIDGWVISVLHEYKDGKLNVYHFRGSTVAYNPPGQHVNIFYYSPNQHLLYMANTNTSVNDSIWSFNTNGYLSPVLPPPNSWDRLKGNKVYLPIQNNGAIGTVGQLLDPFTEFPKGECKTTLFNANLWLGGKDNTDSIRTACGTYGFSGTDFSPGSLDTTNGFFDSTGNDLLDLDKIWKIKRADIEEYIQAWNNGSVSNGTYTIPEAIATWPGNGKGRSSRHLAPYFDRDQNGSYEPQKGDYPIIKGDEMLFWIMNDAGSHGETDGLPMGMEIHASAYVYSCDSLADSDSLAALNYTVYFNYKIINHSNRNYTDFIAAIWVDGDLGNYSDDYIGCDTTGNYGFFYNSDNIDEGLRGYGENPPMFSTVLLSEKMHTFGTYANDFSFIGNPITKEHYYGYLNAQWKDGSPYTYSGLGYQTGGPTRYLFSGNPFDPAQWSEVKTPNTPGDRRLLMSTAPIVLPVGGTKQFSFAFVFSWDRSGPNGATTSWGLNEKYIRQAKAQYVSPSYFQSCESQVPDAFWPVPENAAIGFYPNPAGDQANLDIFSPQADLLTISIYDMNGKRVAMLRNLEVVAGNNTLPLDLSHFTNGLYVLRLENSDQTLHHAFKVIVNK